MPAATHLTASTLSSSHPTVTFARTRVHTMPYGEQDANGASGRAVAIGSLNLTLLSDEQPSLFGTGAHVVHGAGEGISIDTGIAYGQQGDEIRVPHGSVDLMIMNPPFTSPTNHAAEYNVPVPSFAGFATSEDEQRRDVKSAQTHPQRILSNPLAMATPGWPPISSTWRTPS